MGSKTSWKYQTSTEYTIIASEYYFNLLLQALPHLTSESSDPPGILRTYPQHEQTLTKKHAVVFVVVGSELSLAAKSNNKPKKSWQ